MKAELKSIHSPDIFDLGKFDPNEKDNFGILLQLMVSPKNGKGEESFDIMVCTPQWLIRNYQKSDMIFGRHYLIVFEYDYPKIYDKLKEYIGGIEGDTWNEIALKIGRIGKWEFEDYQP
jgi:hypothetical protein